jgi:transcription antitermination factor NusG
MPNCQASSPVPLDSAGDLPSITARLPGYWYVAHTRSRHEKILSTELGRLGIFNYLPLTLSATRSPTTGRVSRSLVPVFPGYVFFKGTEEQRYLALTTNRVANVLAVANQEQLVAELLQVQRLLDNADEFLVARRLRVGEWARIIAGPLRGLEGVITRHAGRLRLAMNVTILGQSVSVEVEHDLVEQIDPPLRSAHGGGPGGRGDEAGLPRYEMVHDLETPGQRSSKLEAGVRIAGSRRRIAFLVVRNREGCCLGRSCARTLRISCRKR